MVRKDSWIKRTWYGIRCYCAIDVFRHYNGESGFKVPIDMAVQEPGTRVIGLGKRCQ